MTPGLIARCGTIAQVLFTADLHIHSKYSRACSKDCDLEHLTWWARRKGITLVGTGDFTHPAWFDHLRDCLVPAEPGLFRLRDDLDRDISRTLPPVLAANPVRFMLSVEISTIYKRADRTRKVHHLVYVPSFDAAAEFNRRLGRIGNLGSDGRPILGLDSRDLLEITLGCGDGAYLVPAHVWTPWFAVFGSKSGFDAIEECYVDLADHIFALETGLSSDPEMNWRISGLDRYRLVSNSDAHSPPMLGREATLFDTDLDYFAVRRALETGTGHAGTLEFFPEEGKYHVDGHRKCGVRLTPQQTREHGGLCPACGKPPTIGVLSRIEDLADRPEGKRPDGAAGFHSLVPLPEIMSEILGVGPKSKRVGAEIDRLTAALGAELAILRDVPIDDIDARSPLLAEAVRRLRRGQVIREAGYDGEYGVIRLFEPGELNAPGPGLVADALFDAPPVETRRKKTAPAKQSAGGDRPTATPQEARGSSRTATSTSTTTVTAAAAAAGPEQAAAAAPSAGRSLLDGLDPDQRAAAEISGGPLLIIAGPGTGKTRTLTHRIAHLVAERDVPPEQCLAITFTRRAAAEMAERLADLVPAHAPRLTIATFHSLGVRLLRELHDRAGLSAGFGIADQALQLAIAAELAGTEKEARRLLTDLSAHRRAAVPSAAHDGAVGSATPGRAGSSSALAADSGPAEPETATHPSPELAAFAERYVKELRQRDLVDFDDLITLPVALLAADPELAAAYQDRYRWICVDEYQDVDAQQYHLLRLLTRPGSDITAIGDPDQAIYRFRGADVGFFLRFQEDFPDARTVRLGRNYRSSATILTAATRLIAPATLVPDRELRPMGDHGDARIVLHEAASEVAEASFVARSIDELLGGSSFHSLDSGRVVGEGTGGLGFSDFAVLYRTDRQSRAIMAALTRSGVPFQKRSHDRLADRPGVAPLVAELAYATGDDLKTRLTRAAATLVDRLPASLSTDDRRDEQAEIHSAVELLTPLAVQCGSDLDRFHTELSLGIEVDTLDPRADRVTLLTLHAAKGLEFPVVFITGCEDGLLPFRHPGEPPDEEAVREERRLLFVGMTRAQRHLFLTHAAERTRRGTPLKASPSPFLTDIPAALYDPLAPASRRRKPRDTQLRLL